MDRFTAGYLECALWSSTDDTGEPLDDNYGVEDLAPEALAQAIEDCREFQEVNAELLATYTRPSDHAGHDYWLSRNGHGAGFWDRGEGETGDALHKAAKLNGSRDLYAGDDGQLYFSGY